MLNLPALTGRDNPRIRAVVQLRRHRDRRRTGLFIAQGMRQIERAVEAGLGLHSGFVSLEVAAGGFGHILAALSTWRGRHAAGRWFSVPAALMARMSYGQRAEPVLAVFWQPGWQLDQDSGRAVSTDRQDPALPQRASWETPLWLVAVGTTKPGNLGAMARSAEAAGAWGLLAADSVVDPFNPNAICASTGAVFRLPVVERSSADALEFLVGQQVRIVAATPRAATFYTKIDLTMPLALVVGAEDRGLAAPWIGPSSRTDPSLEPVAIPMRSGAVDSLNAAAVAAVLLFEAVRQRSE